ncbi:hypothetical protein LN650_31440 [Klebsiella pneumoniae subsp. pneumoniae]|nr:hypothetical protein [Klebsiella pneumoniae subsp. pneumoniae]
MSSDEEAPAQGEPAPDMTGVVDSSFNSKVEQHATTEMQATAADLNKRFDSLQGEVDLLSKARTADQIRIDKLSSDNEAMQTQLKALGVKPAVSGGEPAPTPPSPPPGPEGEPQPASYPPQTGAAGTASDGILSGEWYDTAAAGQLPVCTGTKPDTA